MAGDVFRSPILQQKQLCSYSVFLNTYIYSKAKYSRKMFLFIERGICIVIFEENFLFNKTADNRVFPTPCCLKINTDQ